MKENTPLQDKSMDVSLEQAVANGSDLNARLQCKRPRARQPLSHKDRPGFDVAAPYLAALIETASGRGYASRAGLPVLTRLAPPSRATRNVSRLVTRPAAILQTQVP